MIEVSELVKKYGNHVAVDHLSFQMEKGKIYGFLGPNGAGKSTTMNMLTGYLAASEGSIVINGYDIVKQPEEAKKEIGYLPELPPLYMDMTVYEYLKFVAELKKIEKKEREKQIQEIMELTIISDRKNSLIKNLSKGYRQRVGMAQAILGYPEVIILDEPTVGLDPKQIIEMRDFIISLKEKHTVILSSHILSEVSAICDYIMIISHGKLIASDTPKGLQERIEGKSELEVTLLGTKLQVEAFLAEAEQAKEIEEIHFLEGSEDGCVRVVLTTKEKKDIRQALFYRLAKAELPIMGMHYQEKSLEDIFLELTQEEKQDTIPQTQEQETDKVEEKNEEESEVEEHEGDL